MRIVTSAKRASDSRAVLHRHAMLQHMRAGMLHAEAGKRLEKVNKDLIKTCLRCIRTYRARMKSCVNLIVSFQGRLVPSPRLC